MNVKFKMLAVCKKLMSWTNEHSGAADIASVQRIVF